jgi:hypothetical protein
MSLASYFSKSLFFGIAVDKYDEPGIENLLTPRSDVHAVRKRLELTVNGFEPKILEGENTTKTDICTFLAEMIASVNQRLGSDAINNKRLVFYFAGHGKTLENTDGSATGYIIPRKAKIDDESSWISMDYLLEQFYKLECRHVLLILDCCFAGSLEWAAFNMRGIIKSPKKIYNQHFLLYAKDKAWQVITSAAFDQTSLDYGYRSKEGQQNSPFATALIDALEGSADMLKNGLITASELIVYLRDAVENLANDKNIRHRQTPRLFTLRNHDKGEFLFLNPNSPLILEDAVEATRENNPFKGLEGYDEKDQDKFYGRAKPVSALSESIRKRYADPGRANLLIVTGVSGSGKSSVIKAGVKPAMEKEGWTFLETIRPGELPLEMLAKWSLPKDASAKTVLYIDQLEELVTQARSKDEAEIFLNRLYDEYLCNKNVFLIATLRSDFQHLVNKGKMNEIWKESCYSIPWLDRSELKEIIVQPAVDIAFFYEPVNLVDTIIDDVLQYPGSLPMLSVLLSQLFIKSIENNRNRFLHANDYNDTIGGVSGALHSKLEALLGENNQHEDALKCILLRMVNIEGDIYSKKKVSSTDLQFKEIRINKAVDQQIEVLIKERIIHSFDGTEQAWEPVHDAVVRWSRIKRWIEQIGIERMGRQRELENAIRLYSISGNKSDQWDRNERLEGLKKEIDGGTDSSKPFLLNTREYEFIITSYSTRNKRKRRTLALVSAVILVLTTIAVIAIIQSRIANKEKQLAQTRLEQYQIAQFKENVQNGNTYKEANERILAKMQFDSAYAIYKLLQGNPKLAQEAGRSEFQRIITEFSLDK